MDSLLTQRLMFCDGASVKLIFEENSKLSLSGLESIVTGTFARLAATDNRRPLSEPTCVMGTKGNELCLAVPDFLLGAFRKYAMLDRRKNGGSTKKKQQPGELDRTRFERLRDKTRLIRALTTGEVFTRHQPFRPWPDGESTRRR